MTNVASGSSPVKFRIPLDIMEPRLGEVGDFPYDLQDQPPSWDGPTLFIQGLRSSYVNSSFTIYTLLFTNRATYRYISRDKIDAIKTFFPNMELKSLDTGHWVHAEK